MKNKAEEMSGNHHPQLWPVGDVWRVDANIALNGGDGGTVAAWQRLGSDPPSVPRVRDSELGVIYFTKLAKFSLY